MTSIIQEIYVEFYAKDIRGKRILNSQYWMINQALFYRPIIRNSFKGIVIHGTLGKKI